MTKWQVIDKTVSGLLRQKHFYSAAFIVTIAVLAPVLLAYVFGQFGISIAPAASKLIAQVF